MPSVGSVGDSYDNALAETVTWLYKVEVIHRRGPWRSLEAVEYATLEWVDWFNNRRLLEPIGHVPPADRRRLLRGPGGTGSTRRLTQTNQPPRNPGQFKPTHPPARYPVDGVPPFYNARPSLFRPGVRVGRRRHHVGFLGEVRDLSRRATPGSPLVAAADGSTAPARLSNPSSPL